MARKRHTEPKAANRTSPLRWPLVLWGAICAVGLIFLWQEIRLSWQDLPFLCPTHRASWIRRARPFNLAGWGPVVEIVKFRKRIAIPPHSGPHVITFVALRSCDIYVDNGLLYSSPGSSTGRALSGEPDWNVPHQVTLPSDLSPGEHTFDIVARYNMGPAAVIAYCESLDLRTGRDWTASGAGFEEEPAATVDDIELPALSKNFASPVHALASSLWWLCPSFVVATIGLWCTTRLFDHGELPKWWSASTCRWILIAAWLILAANNFTRLAPGVGYDLRGHVDYIRFIAELGRLPDARDGAQMFQAPLTYLLSAAFYRLLIPFVSVETALIWLRWIPLLCGLAQVELTFRAARLAFPEREDLQSLTVLLGGLLPMNVYMSQVLGNEPLNGALSALVLLWACQGMQDPGLAKTARWQLRVGLALGLALLAKVSALLLAPIVAVVLLFSNRLCGWKPTLAALARCFGAAAAIAGWYFARNVWIFGKPFVGGWDYSVTRFLWWQDPGYRTPLQVESFGQALWHPIHAGFYSIWDGFFATFWLDGNLSAMDSWDARPRWNDTLLVAAPVPAFFLSIALLAGLLRGLVSRDVALRNSLRLAGAGIALYLAAFLMLCIEVPAYSQAKASYTLGLTPLYAICCVAGLDLLPRNAILRSAVAASVVCWSMLVYATYFVR